MEPRLVISTATSVRAVGGCLCVWQVLYRSLITLTLYLHADFSQLEPPYDNIYRFSTHIYVKYSIAKIQNARSQILLT